MITLYQTDTLSVNQFFALGNQIAPYQSNNLSLLYIVHLSARF